VVAVARPSAIGIAIYPDVSNLPYTPSERLTPAAGQDRVTPVGM